MSKSYLNTTDTKAPRGIRNNNPGNLVYTNSKWLGKIDLSKNTDANNHFEQFTELRYGIRAMMIDVRGDIARGKNTVESLIHQYAPSFENNTIAYIASVAKALGLNPADKIQAVSKTVLIALAKAIFRVEIGASVSKYIADADYEEAYQLLPDTTTAVPQKKK